MRVSVVSTAICLSVVGLCSAAEVEAAIRRATHIPAQGLGPALQELAKDHNFQVLYRTKIVGELHTSGAVGELTTNEALTQLLSGTGLTYRYLDDRTVTIVPVAIPSSERATGGASLGTQSSSSVGEGTSAARGEQKSFWQRLKLAQANTSSRSEEQRSAERSSENSQKRIELEEVLVTGTHIRGVQEVANPSITVTREQIEKTGYATLQDVMESLPQNFSGVGADGSIPNSGGSLLSFGNYSDQASAIDLRGLGAEATLTLLNGTRRANSVSGQVVDVSSIPLSVIERVEVLTGGNSAVYGSDAVGGVVNFVTRRDFKGVESQAQYGWSKEGNEQMQLSTIAGETFGRGGFVAAYDYLQNWPLNLLDTGLVSSPTPLLGWIPIENEIIAESGRHSVFFSGRYTLTDRIELHGDGLYSARNQSNTSQLLRTPATNVSTSTYWQDTDQYSASVGARADLGREWSLEVTGALGHAEFDNVVHDYSDFGGGLDFYEILQGSQHDVSSLSMLVNGALPSIGHWTAQAAFGAERREEGYENIQTTNGEVYLPVVRDMDRSIESVFGELNLPLVSSGARTGLQRLDLSVAARYDDYSDFGSSFNPQAGLIWQLTSGLKLRGSYARAFRAPSFVQLVSSDRVEFRRMNDPTAGSGQTLVLALLGESNGDLGPEKADSWSASVDWQPEAAPWLKTSVSYYEVEYKDRISRPMLGADFLNALAIEDRFTQVINRSPTTADIAAALASDDDGLIDNFTGIAFDPATQDPLTVFPGLTVVDNRVSNVAVQNLEGVDVQLDADLQSAVGVFSFGINGTYTLNHDRRVTAASPGVEIINQVGKPVDLRLRASAGWSRGAFGAYAYMNYVDSYSNPFSTPAGGRIDSWTTVDFTLRFDGARFVQTGWLNSAQLTLGISNLLDTEPPVFADDPLGTRYDVANASPFGRQLSLRFVKSW